MTYKALAENGFEDLEATLGSWRKHTDIKGWRRATLSQSLSVVRVHRRLLAEVQELRQQIADTQTQEQITMDTFEVGNRVVGRVNQSTLTHKCIENEWGTVTEVGNKLIAVSWDNRHLDHNVATVFAYRLRHNLEAGYDTPFGRVVFTRRQVVTVIEEFVSPIKLGQTWQFDYPLHGNGEPVARIIRVETVPVWPGDNRYVAGHDLARGEWRRFLVSKITNATLLSEALMEDESA
jgi:hypothetical protein